MMHARLCRFNTAELAKVLAICNAGCTVLTFIFYNKLLIDIVSCVVFIERTYLLTGMMVLNQGGRIAQW